jgi:hypothetical protein
MKITLGDIKTNVARMLSMSGTDARVVDYINEAQERLLYKGKWVGTYARYAINSSNGTITWPRELETIESVAVADDPAIVRNEWFEFLETGYGIQDSQDSDAKTLIDRGEACVFSDIAGTDKKLRLYTGHTSDAGKRVLLQGYDQNGEWVRSQDGTTWVDGEYVTLTTTFVDTNSLFAELVAVQKDDTATNVKVYELKPSDSTTRLIAEYQPNESRPVYRRSLIAGLKDSGEDRVVTIVGKLRFVPAKDDTDWLMISNEPALKEMVLSIRKAENNLPQEAIIYERRAVSLLQDQLLHYIGDGAVGVPRFQNVATFGGGGVSNLQ